MCLLNFYRTSILTATFCKTECINRLIKVTDIFKYSIKCYPNDDPLTSKHFSVKVTKILDCINGFYLLNKHFTAVGKLTA
jgi:pyruvate-formate lyase-activating enzyme